MSTTHYVQNIIYKQYIHMSASIAFKIERYGLSPLPSFDKALRSTSDSRASAQSSLARLAGGSL